MWIAQHEALPFKAVDSKAARDYLFLRRFRSISNPGISGEMTGEAASPPVQGRDSMHRSGRLVPYRAFFLPGFLTITFVLTAGLALDALRREHSHRRTAERLLDDYARFAAWQFGRTAHEHLSTGIEAALRPVTQAVADGAAEEDLPPASVLTPTGTRRTACGCPVADSIHEYFRFDFSTRVVSTACGAPPRDGSTGAALSLARHARGSYRPHWGYATLFVREAGVTQALAYTLVHDGEGRPLAAYGFKTPFTDFGGPALRTALTGGPVLPPSLAGDLPTDSLVAITVLTPAGDTLFRSEAAPGVRHASADTLSGPLAGVVVAAALTRSGAERLLPAGSSRPGISGWLILLTLNGLLVGLSLAHVQKERDLVHARSQFVSRLAHELRTPVSEIRVYAEMLRLGRTRSDAERQRSLEIIDEQSARLAHLADNVLHYSDPRTGRTRVQPEPSDLSAEVRKVLEAYQPVAFAGATDLRLEIEEGVAGLADRGALQQILVNLLDNAVKFGPPGQRVVVGLARAPGVVRLWVDDQGPGVPLALREQVFESYFRSGPGASAGRGIGLTVVRELVESHGGRVWIEDAPAGGARVVVELPGTPPTVPVLHLQDLRMAVPAGAAPDVREKASA